MGVIRGHGVRGRRLERLERGWTWFEGRFATEVIAGSGKERWATGGGGGEDALTAPRESHRNIATDSCRWRVNCETLLHMRDYGSEVVNSRLKTREIPAPRKRFLGWPGLGMRQVKLGASGSNVSECHLHLSCHNWASPFGRHSAPRHGRRRDKRAFESRGRVDG